MMQVGFAGLGRMGTPMARNLARAGFDLTIWNRSADKARTLAEDLGCAVADTPRKLAESSAVVVTMLADDACSEAVHRGPDGLFAGEAARCFIEIGTMSPEHIATLVAEAPQGTTVIEAPVSGATQDRRA
jgi:3-hydroxyisobutyrate dehydrogenase